MASRSGGAHCAAIILAAGRGERMRPLTDTTPKPLLRVQGKPLMQWPLEALARGGFGRVVVNTAWLGEQISAQFGSPFRLQPANNLREQLSNQEHESAQGSDSVTVHIDYSHEGIDFGGALETAGGIARALPLLCRPPPCTTSGTTNANASAASELDAKSVFWVLAGDVFAPDFVFSPSAVERFVASGKLAHIWLVPNPAHNPHGDFGLGPTQAHGLGLALNLHKDDPQTRYTYSTIGMYRAALFAPPWCAIPPGNPHGTKAALAPLLRAAMAQEQVSAELYTGPWTDVGTPERLAELNPIG
jgi:MurNAc alpha-1-phosphate uridylyltransferase